MKEKKRTWWIVDFAVPEDHKVKMRESKMRDKYLDVARELKNKQTMEHESDCDTNCN